MGGFMSVYKPFMIRKNTKSEQIECACLHTGLRFPAALRLPALHTSHTHTPVSAPVHDFPLTIF